MIDQKTHARLIQYVAEWPEEWRDYFHERAGIREFDAHLDRVTAEVLAFEDVRRKARLYNQALPGEDFRQRSLFR